MGMKYNIRPKHYTIAEIMNQVFTIKKILPETTYEIVGSKHIVNTYVYLKPTEHSERYRIKLTVHVGKTYVDVSSVSPKINRVVNGKKVPHMYKNETLCLFYPGYNEWHYSDKWMETLIPWASLWLFYYEIWIVTGEWLGGGIHGSDNIHQSEIKDNRESATWMRRNK